MKFWRIAAGAAAVVAIAVVGAFGYVALYPAGPEPVAPIAGAPADLPAGMTRGEYLTRAADCVACHTAEKGKDYAGGRPFKLPFGTIYATNITPDKETGIGNWSDDAFVEAVRAGMGSEGHLYPAMPYTSYAALSRDDVLEIKRYLMTLAPVRQAPPENTLSFPFNQRWGMAFWNLAFFREERFAHNPAKSQAWNRGAYLAGPLGHCGECHTPRNIGFAMKSREYLSGTVVQGWKAYNTTSDGAYGVGDWTDAQLEGYLWRGHAPGRSSAAGPMGEVVENSLQHLTQTDIKALVGYLRAVEPSTGASSGTVELKPAGATASNAVLPGEGLPGEDPRGRRLFAGDCAGCHQWNGAGRQTHFASLVGSRSVNDPSGVAVVQVLLHGTTIEVQGRRQTMPGFAGSYSDEEVASLANFVLQHFGSKTGAVSPEQVSEQRQQK